MKNVRMLAWLVMLLLTACGGVRAGNPQPPPNDFEGIAGRVLARAGSGAAPLANVTVRVGDQSVVTDEYGFWRISGSVGAGDTVAISVRHNGYAPYVQVLPRRQAAGRFVTTSLRPVAATKRILVAEGGVVVVPGSGASNAAAVRIAPKSLQVDAKEVDVAVSIVRPEVPEELAAFPGEFLGKADGLSGGQDLLRTLGTLDVSFTADGEALDSVELSEPAKLQMALDDEFGAEFAEGATIPTWWLDPASGAWIGEGSARVIKQNDRKLASWSAKHFTWWNLDMPLETHACLAVRLIAADEPTKLAMQGLLLSISGVDYAGTSRAAGFSDDGLAVVTGWRGHTVKPALKFAGTEAGLGLNTAIAALLWGSNAVFALPETNASTLSGKGPDGKALNPAADCLYKEYQFALELGTVRGRVLDEYARPLSGAVVVIAEFGRTMVSAGDGSFVFDGVPYQEDGRLSITVSAIPPAQRGEIYFDDLPIVRDRSESRAELVALVRESPPVFTSQVVSNSNPPVNTTVDFSMAANDTGRRLQWAVKACGQLITLESEADTLENDKTVLCHLPPGNPDNAQTIAVGAAAVAAHLAHGDREGLCAGTDPSRPPTISSTSGENDAAPGACTLSAVSASAEQSGTAYSHHLTGKWTGTVAAAHTISVAAKDWLGYHSQKDRTVVWKNNPPVLFWDAPKYGRINDFISVAGLGDDADGDAVTVQWLFNGVAAGSGTTVVLGPVVDGPNYIVAQVSDGHATVSQRYVVYGSVTGNIMAPDTVLTSAPASPSADTTPTFTFTSPLLSATFECRLDLGAWASCASPHTATVNGIGVHTFAVRAVDPDGRYDATPAFLSWDLFFGWRSFSLGSRHSCGIYNEGVLACWGGNSYGQAGLGMIHSQPLTQPTVVTLGPVSKRWLVVSAGYEDGAEVDSTCGIASDHSLWCWGQNRGGTLVPTGTSPVTVPTQVGFDQDWLEVQLANDIACALKQDRSLYCWGEGEYGPDARTGDGANVVRTAPHLVTGGITWDSYDLGVDDVCGISTGGSLHCWGKMGPSGDTVPTPALINSEIDWAAVSVGRDHACALKTDHTLWCWGINYYLALGVPGPNQPAPIQLPDSDWRSVSAALTATCAVKLDNTLWCWGTEAYGIFSDGLTDSAFAVPTLVSLDADWDEIQLLSESACGLKADHSLRCWGANWLNNLGAGLVYESAYLKRIVAPAFSALSELADTRCGLDGMGAIFCAGKNFGGQTGQPPSTFDMATFTQLPGGKTWQAVGANRSDEWYTSTDSCALDTAGFMYCWGTETNGEYGDGVTANDGPTPVLSGGGKQWLAFSMGASHACAIDTATAMWCWGTNGSMQMAGASSGTTVVYTPNLLPATGWTRVQAAKHATCGLQASALYCWGKALAAQFGISGDASSMTPIAETPGRTWSDFSLSATNICAIDTNGSLWCWGNNAYGQLGYFGAGSSTPVAVSMATDWARVFVGQHHACALKSNGTLWCFGYVSLEEGMPSNGTMWQIGADNDWAGYYPGVGENCALKTDGSMWCAGTQKFGQWGDGGHTAFLPQRVFSPVLK